MFYNQARTEVLSTYALCGFANLGSIGSVIASLGAMAPSRKSEAAMLGMRAMICGTVASYMITCGKQVRTGATPTKSSLI